MYPQQTPSVLSDIVIISSSSSSSRRRPLATTIQGIQADIAALATIAIAVGGGGDPDGLPGRLVVLEEVAQLLLADVDALAPRRAAHLHHRAEQVQVVGDVGGAREDDEEQEEDGVAQDCLRRLALVINK